jgi:catechol 2,3-dioxygenase-like lactoylglutathione lyase family enzyme
MQIRGVLQVGLRATDPEASVAFYRDVLGLKLIARFDPPGLSFFDVAGVRLLLERNGAPGILYYLPGSGDRGGRRRVACEGRNDRFAATHDSSRRSRDVRACRYGGLDGILQRSERQHDRVGRTSRSNGTVMTLRGKVVPATGAASGIGPATAQKAASNGARVILTDRNDAAANSFATELAAPAAMPRICIRT